MDYLTENASLRGSCVMQISYLFYPNHNYATLKQMPLFNFPRDRTLDVISMLPIFPSPGGMSLSKLSLAGNN
jgi:hypothetical protein